MASLTVGSAAATLRASAISDCSFSNSPADFSSASTCEHKTNTGERDLRRTAAGEPGHDLHIPRAHNKVQRFAPATERHLIGPQLNQVTGEKGEQLFPIARGCTPRDARES